MDLACRLRQATRQRPAVILSRKAGRGNGAELFQGWADTKRLTWGDGYATGNADEGGGGTGIGYLGGALQHPNAIKAGVGPWHTA